LASIIFFKTSALWIIYPLVLLAGDYSASQVGTEDDNFLFRVSLIGTAAFFLMPIVPFSIAIALRMSVVLLFIIKLTFSRNVFYPLKIKSPIYFLATVYICYSGVMIVIPLLPGTEDRMKFWYLASQVGLGLLLKRADFLSRASTLNSPYLSILSFGGAALMPVIGVILFPDFRYILIYLFGAAGLIYATRYLMSEK